jgi:outer membrane cobalamin receptor
MKTTLLRTVFFVLTFLVVPAFLRAQSNSGDAHISGKVTDASGYGIGGVRISAQLENSPDGQVWSATSNTQGEYSLVLPPGRYRIHFEHAAFITRELALDAASAATRNLDLGLEIKQLSDKVVVTANAQPLPTSETPAPVDVVDLQEIEQRQLVSLADALAMVPGAAIARTGAEGDLTTFFLDGGNSNFTKFFIDGTPVNEPGGYINLSNQTLDNIDKVEVVHGAESALYGSDAVDGVVQLFSHRGTTRIPEATVFGEGGSYSSGRGGAQLAGALGGFDYSVAGSYLQTDGQGPNDAFLNRNFAGNFGYSFSDSNQLRLAVRSGSSYAGIPGQTLLEPASLSQYEALKVFLTRLTWDFHTGPHWEHRVSATENRTLDTNANPPYYTAIDQYNRAGFQEQSTYSFRNGGIAAGYEYEVENGYPSDLSGEHARRNNQAGFIDARWLPISRITLSAGTRAEDNTSFGTRVLPRAGAVLAVRYGKDFWGDTRARVSYGQGFKEPSLDESFGNDPCFPGNSALRPERSNTFDIGLDQFFASDKASISGTYFANRYRDIVSFTFDPTTTPACPFGTGTYFNTDLARARGVNLSGQVHLRRWLTAKGSYSYDDSRVLESPNAAAAVELPGNHLLRRPVNSGTVILNAAYQRFNFNLSGYFTGRRTDSDFLGFGYTYNPGYARFDATTSYDLKRGLTLYARATNLFDKSYQDAIGYPALGRDVRVGVRYRFGGGD